ncbi:MAG TPA: AAA family ATPase [Mucilaginibacter sp.]|nr:AAA family ATPase [Mucilaginibacter sp.]
MELIERAAFLDALHTIFKTIKTAEGHCLLLSGEAGIGKTSLVRTFCNEIKGECKILQGTCDALFTPRPLAPLYDIAWQMQSDIMQRVKDKRDRAALFTSLLQELNAQKEPVVLIFEDIHWADEATLDFIKFLARRINYLHCLFILTYRDNEIHSGHPLRNVFGQLSRDTFTRLQLTALSKEAVETMSAEKGYSGESVYSITGGNPFYVTEILASYSSGVPDNVKDSILSVYNRQNEKIKEVWKLLSVQPTGFETKYLLQIEPACVEAIELSLESGILLHEQGRISFKHELYRRTIESSLSPLLRVALNKKILDLFLKDFEQNQEIERIIHHAKNANEYELVVHYALIAAKTASCIGAHNEAAKLYFSAIEYYQGNNKSKLHELYEGYAYECYLINKHKDAIIYMNRSLKLWEGEDDKERASDCMRSLSRLGWVDGNRKQAESFASQAIDLLNDQPDSKSKAMAYSNMSQLTMIYNQYPESIYWGEKAIVIAKKLEDDEILSHALNNVGTVKMRIASTKQEGLNLLQQSLEIALRNSYHEHAARAYSNLGCNGILIKDYPFAKGILETGYRYCEEKDMDSWGNHMLGHMARLKLDTGCWAEAYNVAENLINNTNQGTIFKVGAMAIVATIKMRRGDTDILPVLMDAKAKAFGTMELQRIIPVLAALLEYEWITGKVLADEIAIDYTIIMLEQAGDADMDNEFAYWLLKAREKYTPFHKSHNDYNLAAKWEKSGCPYEQALALFEGDEADKRKAICMVQELGAAAVYEKLKMEMRASGIKSIPRGIRETTRSNIARLTEREVDVLKLLKDGMQNKEIADRLFISAKTVDNHITSILCKLDVNSRVKAVHEAINLEIIK